MKHENDHVLIDTYLKKSLMSRLGTWLLRCVVLAALLLFGSFIAWRMLPGSKQASLRDQFPVVEKAATFLEEKGFAPYTADIVAREEREERRKSGSSTGVGSAAERSQAPKQKDRAARQAKKPAMTETERRAAAVEQIESGQGMVLSFEGIDDGGERDAKVAKMLEAVDAHNERQLKKAAAAAAALDRREAEIRETRESIAKERVQREAATRKFLKEGGLSVSWKPWDKHFPPTWDDFRNQNVDQEISKWGAYISTILIPSYNGNRWEVFAVMLREGSWVRPGLRTEKVLRHERLHFDITELFARKLRVLIPQTPRSEVPKLIVKVQNEVREFQTLYDRECHGNPEKQAEWEKNIASRLDETKHLQWVNDPERLAKGGFPVGSFLLGQIYDHDGIGHRKSPRLAKKWYKLGIQKRSSYAMNNLAAMYQQGLDGEAPDQKRAFKLYRRAAKDDNVFAQFNLGVMYWRGLGTDPDREKAMEMFTRAADSVPYARKALLILEGGADDI